MSHYDRHVHAAAERERRDRSARQTRRVILIAAIVIAAAVLAS